MKRVTFKEFIMTLFCGIWQAIRWIAGMFGYNDRTCYGVVVRRIFAGCLAVFAILFTAAGVCGAYVGVKEEFFSSASEESDNDYSSVKYVSRNVDFQIDKNCIVNNATGLKIEDVDWICMSIDGDSLVCYATNGKRGYFNKYTGRVVIEPRYSRAWIFSDGLSCVEENDSLIFIDHDGKKAFDRSFKFSNNADGYVFHDGYCIMGVADYSYGVINKKGEWIVEPRYVDVKRGGGGFWILKDKNGYGLYNDSIQRILLPCEYRYVCNEVDGIVVQYQDYTMQRLNYDLSVKDAFVFTDIHYLRYPTGEFDDDNNQIMSVATCKRYEVAPEWNVGGGRYGLMGPDGRPLTKPIYESIVAIAKDLYKCGSWRGNVLVNSKGHIIQ